MCHENVKFAIRCVLLSSQYTKTRFLAAGRADDASRDVSRLGSWGG